MTHGRLLALLGAIALIIGAVMPWAVLVTAFGTVQVYGHETVGLYTGILGGVSFFFALFVTNRPGKIYHVLIAILGVICFGLTLDRYIIIAENLNLSSYVNGTVGTGLYLTFLGSILLIVGGFLRFPAFPAPPPPVSIEQEDVQPKKPATVALTVEEKAAKEVEERQASHKSTTLLIVLIAMALILVAVFFLLISLPR
jgi:hypothetical protein